MNENIYLDTSVLGATCDPGPDERLQATTRFRDGLRHGKWNGYISGLVLEEIARASEAIQTRIQSHLADVPLLLLEESDISIALAQAYLDAGAIPHNYRNDARHVAMATTNHITVIVSWNFRHMVNLHRKRELNSVNMKQGYPLIDLVSPMEMNYEEQ
ncbi:MAG: hypothetical protein NPIRA02_02240 [Nitrospirales bacterium]|nr:MAG: hypothetical protein NPIRA02_02240 [Nitrospirales bacterium]